MAVKLDYADIQGNILTAYGKQGFPKGRFMLFHIEKGDLARRVVTELLPMVTTALRWRSAQNISTGDQEVPRPDVAVNIAFTWYGLLALGVPTRTLRGMPDEFIDGMTRRAPMLGDDFKGDDWKKSWDEVWINSGNDRGAHADTVHVLITLNAQMNPNDGFAVPALDETSRTIEALCEREGAMRLLVGHNQKDRPAERYQDLSALLAHRDGKVAALPKEHFGFTDGLSDPVFYGQYPGGEEEAFAAGNGAFDGSDPPKWRPLATGEFLLGYPDEAQEIAGAAMPLDFSRNGAFMAYRKLHQNVDAFRTFFKERAIEFGAVFGIENPDDAEAMLMAKMVGRWSDGVPVLLAPTIAERNDFNRRYPDVDYASDPNGWAARYAAMTQFTYRGAASNDPAGSKCPITSHLRRVNVRDDLGPTKGAGSVLTNRRRILRRGLPYGDSPPGATDAEEHGIVMLVVCASLFRQFEFVQQQWINYGLDARSGNDTCPIVGNHSDGGPQAQKAKFVIAADPTSGHPPFIVESIPQFVETRGGEYFFAPSMTALRMIGMGVIDPT
jgi:Dyp-type peroxidase family